MNLTSAGNNNGISRSSSDNPRSPSRSSSRSSFLTDFVNGVADKIIRFTKDEGRTEDELFLPISARQRREADDMSEDVFAV